MAARRREGACGGQGADRLRRGLRSGRGEDACRPSDRRRGPAALLAARPTTPSSRCRDGRAAGVRLAFENLRHPLHLKRVLDTFDSRPSVYVTTAATIMGGAGKRIGSSNTGPGCLPSTSTTTTGHGTATPSLLTAGSDWKALSSRIARTGYAGPTALEVEAGEEYEGRMSADAFLLKAAQAAARIGKMRAEG